MKITLYFLFPVLIALGCGQETLSKIDYERVSELEMKAIQASWSNPTLDSSMYYFNQALEIDSLHVGIYRHKVEMYLEAGRCSEAWGIVESMPLELKEWPAGLGLKGLVHEHFGRLEEAVETYNEALAKTKVPMHRGEDDIMEVMGYWYLQTAAGERDKALASIEIVEGKELTEVERLYIAPLVERVRNYKGNGYLDLMEQQKRCHSNY